MNNIIRTLPSGPRLIGTRVCGTVPARRTKANREHRVPLCGRALEILDGARTLVKGTSPYLFPNRLGKQLEEKQLRRMLAKHKIAAVPHGFRSSFRDWGGRGDESSARGHRSGPRTCGPEQGRGSLSAHGPIRPPTSAHGRLGCLSQPERRENQRPRLPEGMPPSSDEKLGRSSGALVMANRIRKSRKWSR